MKIHLEEIKNIREVLETIQIANTIQTGLGLSPDLTFSLTEYCIKQLEKATGYNQLIDKNGEALQQTISFPKLEVVKNTVKEEKVQKEAPKTITSTPPLKDVKTVEPEKPTVAKEEPLVTAETNISTEKVSVAKTARLEKSKAVENIKIVIKEYCKAYSIRSVHDLQRIPKTVKDSWDRIINDTFPEKDVLVGTGKNKFKQRRNFIHEYVRVSYQEIAKSRTEEIKNINIPPVEVSKTVEQKPVVKTETTKTVEQKTVTKTEATKEQIKVEVDQAIKEKTGESTELALKDFEDPKKTTMKQFVDIILVNYNRMKHKEGDKLAVRKESQSYFKDMRATLQTRMQNGDTGLLKEVGANSNNKVDTYIGTLISKNYGKDFYKQAM